MNLQTVLNVTPAWAGWEQSGSFVRLRTLNTKCRELVTLACNESTGGKFTQKIERLHLIHNWIHNLSPEDLSALQGRASRVDHLKLVRRARKELQLTEEEHKILASKSVHSYFSLSELDLRSGHSSGSLGSSFSL